MAEKTLEVRLRAKNQTTQALDGASKDADRAGRAFGGLDGNMRRLTGAFAGFAGIAGVQRVFANWFQTMERVNEQTVALEHNLTELLSLGGNVNQIDAIRGKIVSMSTAWNLMGEEASRALFDLQSGTANLNESIRKDLLRSGLELKAVYGADLPTGLSALIKTYQIYRGEIDRVQTLQQKLAFTAEEGFLTFGDMATQLPDVASAARAMRISLDEVLASLVVATQRGGKTEKTFTGVRNVFLRMANAEREGIHLTGSFVEKLKQLETVDADVLKKIFGDEAIAVIANLTSATDQFGETLGRLATDLPDVGEKMAKRLEDTTSRFVAIADALERLKGNQLAGLSPGQMGQLQGFQAAQVGLESVQARNGLTNTSVAPKLTAAIFSSRFAAEALDRVFEQAINENRIDLARAVAGRMAELGIDTTAQNAVLRGETTRENLARMAAERRQVNAEDQARAAARRGPADPWAQYKAELNAARMLGVPVSGRRHGDVVGDIGPRAQELGQQVTQSVTDAIKRAAGALMQTDAVQGAVQLAGNLRGAAAQAATDAANDQARAAVDNAVLITDQVLSGFGDVEAEVRLGRRRITDQITQRVEELQQALVDEALGPAMADEVKGRIAALNALLPDALRREEDRIRESFEDPSTRPSGGGGPEAIDLFMARFRVFGNQENPDERRERIARQQLDTQKKNLEALKMLVGYIREGGSMAGIEVIDP